jgi:hypothetical protein
MEHNYVIALLHGTQAMRHYKARDTSAPQSMHDHFFHMSVQ